MLVFVALTATIWASGNATKASIVSSPHDFTSSTYTFAASGSSTSSSATTNLCFFCHILHKTATNSSGVATTSSLAPGYMMWNHQLSSQASYGVYSSDTFNAVLAAAGVAPPTDLGSNNNINSPTVSNLCLSCHDGTVAIASFYESGFGLPANGSTWNNGHGASTYMYTGMQISDLTKVHPVHFQYTPALASAAGITSPASPNSVDGSGAVPLYGGAYYMECTTCHDPHNGATAVHGSLFPFARSALASVSGSFCTYCHS
jgi:hypothetical protein